MNNTCLYNILIVVLFIIPFNIQGQHFYFGVGYTTMDPKSTAQASYYRQGYSPRLEREYFVNANYEHQFGKTMSLSVDVRYIYNTNKNVLWIDPTYHPQINPLLTVLRYSFNNISHLISPGISFNLDMIKIKKTTVGLSTYFNAGFLFKKQTQPIDIDDFKFSTHKFKPFNLEAYPLLYAKINRFKIQVGARVYSLKYFDEVVELRYGEIKPKADNSNPLKLMANIAYRL